MKLLKQVSHLFTKPRHLEVKKEKENEEKNLSAEYLQCLKSQALPLTIHFPTSRTPYVSTVLEVTPSFLVIDQINHPQGHHLALQKMPFTALARVQNTFISFESTLSHYENESYHVAYPVCLQYKERRKIERLTLSPSHCVHADFFIPTLPRIRAQILDISTGGLRLCIPYNLKNTLNKHTRIEACRIINPFFASHEFSLQLRNYHYDLATQSTIAGYQFINLDNTKLTFLSRLIECLVQETVSK